jgi:uncharacterized protein YndB with AHSA1/START domain
MEPEEQPRITVQASIDAPVAVVWKRWTTPDDIVHWNSASVDWHTPWAKNDLREGGRFTYRMECRDGSSGFDFSGVYEKVVPNKEIDYLLDDGRRVRVLFRTHAGQTEVLESFEPEEVNSSELQRSGWKAILDSFKKYTEAPARP